MGVYLLADLDWWTKFDNLVALMWAGFWLGVVIFVHELGHFLVAKACGVKCEKFYVGFDPPFKYFPRAIWKKKWGETEYGIGIIPLGGYVKMLGQDDNPANAAREAERIRVAKEQQGPDASDDVLANDYALDPRSYPAKSVPQRMAIISAGVIMNMIFAVIFAMVAYLMGVDYMPCNVGSTVPGDPAWQAGLRPGDKIIQLGEDGAVDEQLRFTRDLRYAVASTGSEGQLSMKVRRADGSVEPITIQPSSTLQKELGIATIGIFAASTNRIVSGSFEADYVARILGQETSPDPDPNRLARGDRVVAIQAGSERYVIDDDHAYQIIGILTRHPSDELTFEVERDNNDEQSNLPAQRSVTVSPLPMRDLGITMNMGPVVAVKPDSPADRGGLRAGDVITAIDGQPVWEPLRIDQQLLGHLGEPTKLTVLRNSAQQTITVTPEAPMNPGQPTYYGGPMSAETIGAAMKITNLVHSVVADRVDSIQPGDVIEKACFVDKESKLSRKQILKLGLARELSFGEDGKHSWADLIRAIQLLPPEVDVLLTISRGTKQQIVEVKPAASYEWFDPRRDIMFQQLTQTRKAASLGEAFLLGNRETWAGVEQVLFTLKNIRKHLRHLGGPVTIAAVATHEASEGPARLLVFLTLLSANLAVINFLPIPVLDGGHMMFLLAEGVRGKPVNERWAFYLTMIGFSFILALMVFVIYLDVDRWIFPGISG